MAWARPSSPVSTARSGRTMGSGRKRRSSRRSRGSSPARRNDDFPAPDGPRITNSDSTPEVRIPRSTSRPRRIWASRPKNTAASASSSGAHPRYGARSGSPGGGHGKCSAPIPSARSAVQQPLQAHGVQHHRLPAIADVDFGGGAVVGEQVAALPLRGDAGVGHRLQPGAQDGLVQRSRRSGTRSGTRARLPSAWTAGRSPPRSGCWPAAAPASTVPRAGCRCAGPDPKRSPRPDPAPARPATP